MRYMLLVHHDEEAFGELSEARQQHMLEESVQLTHQLHANKQYLHASPLHPAANAQDLNEAIRIATRVPGARIGTVEVRPVKDISGLPGE